MSLVLRGLPVLVETDADTRPVAFWLQSRRHRVVQPVCLWEDSCSSTVHWLVEVAGEQPVSLIYDRAAGEWVLEGIENLQGGTALPEEPAG